MRTCATRTVSCAAAIAAWGLLSGNGVFEVGYLTSRADIIARVTLVSRSPVDDVGVVAGDVGEDSPGATCGHRYQAKVMESIKGRHADFSFFAAVAADFKGYDTEYLVFVYRRDQQKVKQAIIDLRDQMTDDELAVQHCRSAGEYYLPMYPQAMVAFGPQDPDGTRWVMPPDRAPVTWCFQSGDDLGSRLRGRRVVRGESTVTMVEWTGLRDILQETLTAKHRLLMIWRGLSGGFQLPDC